jgi:hypothetical protein
MADDVEEAVGAAGSRDLGRRDAATRAIGRVEQRSHVDHGQAVSHLELPPLLDGSDPIAVF